jgi:LmbE family N-acetylglucosaminyl deacetylase
MYGDGGTGSIHFGIVWICRFGIPDGKFDSLVPFDSTMERILVLGAHPDDAEFFAGGLLASHADRGSAISIVSVTNGQSGHHELPSDQLVERRRREAAASGSLLKASYVTWDFPDGYLQPTIELREAIIRAIRAFQPSLVLTHRPFDYHPDHRAVGQAVQDASYMVLVPKIAPGYPTPPREPLVAYMVDLFTRPCPFRADVVIDVSSYLDRVIDLLSCHESQFFEWMPWIERNEQGLPREPGAEQRQWLRNWYLERTRPRAERFWNQSWGSAPELLEAYEISEYAGRPNDDLLERLFPYRKKS